MCSIRDSKSEKDAMKVYIEVCVLFDGCLFYILAYTPPCYAFSLQGIALLFFQRRVFL